MNRIKALLTSSFARFLLVGLFNTLVGLSASFAFFNLLHLNYWISTFAGNTIGAVVSYTLNRTFTFRSNVSIGSSWWKFAVGYFESAMACLMVLVGFLPKLQGLSDEYRTGIGCIMLPYWLGMACTRLAIIWDINILHSGLMVTDNPGAS